jgi:hypothetical protein
MRGKRAIFLGVAKICDVLARLAQIPSTSLRTGSSLPRKRLLRMTILGGYSRYFSQAAGRSTVHSCLPPPKSRSAACSASRLKSAANARNSACYASRNWTFVFARTVCTTASLAARRASTRYRTSDIPEEASSSRERTCLSFVRS